MKNPTTQIPYDHRNTDSVLEFFRTPTHQARILRARRRTARALLERKILTYSCLILAGFLLGILATCGILL